MGLRLGSGTASVTEDGVLSRPTVGGDTNLGINFGVLSIEGWRLGGVERLKRRQLGDGAMCIVELSSLSHTNPMSTMTSSNLSSADPSRTSTPNPATVSRFTAQASTAEDLLKSQTVGLVHLSDFRKRRAEALQQKEREAQDRSLGRYSGSATPASDG